MLLYVYACIMCMGLYMCMCVHTHARERWWVSFFITFHFSDLQQGLSLNLKLARLASQARSLESTPVSAPASPGPGLQAHIAMSSVYRDAGDLNPHPHACTARAPYPLSRLSNPGTVVLKRWLDYLQPC